jgi:hypothetical protein
MIITLIIVGGLSFAWFQFILFMSFFKDYQIEKLFKETMDTSAQLNKKQKSRLKWTFDRQAANTNDKKGKAWGMLIETAA